MMIRDEQGKFTKGSGLQDLSGIRFGRLTAVELSDKRSGRKTYWECKCACGNTKTVRTDNLKSGLIRSCGCLKKEQDKINFKDSKFKPTHGETKTHIYQTWSSMKQRCNDKNSTSYKYYGNRGIKVCDEWKDDYESFKNWAFNNGYDSSLSIERIDVNGDYEPSNCSWITMEKQAQNKQNTIWIEYNGDNKPLVQWCEELGLDKDLVRNRYKLNMQLPDLFSPTRVSTKTSHLITYRGKTQSVTEWAKEIGISRATLFQRIYRGMEQPELFYPGSLNHVNTNKKIPR